MTEVARLLKEQLAGNPCSLWSELKDFMCFFPVDVSSNQSTNCRTLGVLGESRGGRLLLQVCVLRAEVSEPIILGQDEKI